MENKKDEILCSCGGGGGGGGAYHVVGVGGCFRYHITDEKDIPRNRRLFQSPNGLNWIWDVGDHSVTEYTLFHQRLYSQDEIGQDQNLKIVSTA